MTAPPHRRHLDIDGLARHADHVDVKTVEADVSLREFVAGALAHEPSWMRVLYRARSVLARMLRLDDPDITAGVKLAPADIPFEPGSPIAFFRVVDAEEERHFVVEASDNHLTGQLGVFTESLGDGRSRFSVATFVHYHRWTGPLYFNLIRPFHHLVVRSMVKAGARGWRGHRGDPRGDSRTGTVGDAWEGTTAPEPSSATGRVPVAPPQR